MIRPSLELAIAVNEAVREEDEWFDEPDDLERLAAALASISSMEDPLEAAAVLVYRVTRAQAFGEASKRTAYSSPGGCWTGTGSTGASSSQQVTDG